MPTGYTAAIADGITFEQYALNCARAFGALVMMRDEPSDAPIPDAFAPSDYNARELVQDRAKLSSMKALSGDALAQVHAEAVKADAEYNANRLREANELRAKYEAMLAQAKAYKPPTPDHVQYAAFLVSQIEQSIEFDCTPYEREPITSDPHLWRAQEIEKIEKSIAYHERAHREELERTARRNQWIRDLRASLNGPATTKEEK